MRNVPPGIQTMFSNGLPGIMERSHVSDLCPDKVSSAALLIIPPLRVALRSSLNRKRAECRVTGEKQLLFGAPSFSCHSSLVTSETETEFGSATASPDRTLAWRRYRKLRAAYSPAASRF